MALINSHSKNITEISNLFIDEYMPKANGTFVKVYLYAYKNFCQKNFDLTSKQISQVLNILESDVIEAWKYWHEQGIIRMQFNEASRDYDVEYLPIIVSKSPVQSSIPINRLTVKPQYLPDELKIYQENNEEVKDLFDYSQKTLGKMLTVNDTQVIFSMYDWLRLPIEVIKVLLEAYSSKSIRYIEKVAIEWADDGVDTIEKAQQRLSYIGHYKAIMKLLLGTGSGMPVEAQKKYMDKWLKVYSYDMSIIEQAAKRAGLKPVDARFQYADGILSNWYKANIKTVEDIVSFEDKFQQSKKAEAEKKQESVFNQGIYKSAPATKKQNRFVNYEQRERDFDEMERLERQYIDKKIEGN